MALKSDKIGNHTPENVKLTFDQTEALSLNQQILFVSLIFQSNVHAKTLKFPTSVCQ